MSDKKLQPAVIALGYFDSVHRGHREVISRARALADLLKVRLAVFTFGGNLKASLCGGEEKYVYSPKERAGILRSLGARKKDISRVFTAESAMIGAFSGFIGVIMSLAFSAIGNAVLAFLVKIQGLMAPTWWHYLLMFFVSILLAVVAGFAPSRVAAKKDPTVALRSE